MKIIFFYKPSFSFQVELIPLSLQLFSCAQENQSALSYQGALKHIKTPFPGRKLATFKYLSHATKKKGNFGEKRLIV